MAKEKCWRCHGRGKVRVERGLWDSEERCPTCQGTGTIDKGACTMCGGHGKRQTTFPDNGVPAQYETCPKCNGTGKA